MNEKNIKYFFWLSFVISISLEIYVRVIAKRLYGIDGFGLWPSVDIAMHFFWGLSIFLFLIVFFKWDPLGALLAVFLWQMAWEVIEMLGDIMIVQPEHMYDHFFFDGIKDTIVDLAGAGVGWILVGKRKLVKNKFTRFMKTYILSIILLCILGTFIWLKALLDGTYFQSPDLFAVAWIIASAIIIYIYVWRK